MLVSWSKREYMELNMCPIRMGLQHVVVKLTMSLKSTVHTSNLLRDQGFDIQQRAEIEVKGKGQMTTYFLFENLLECEAANLGQDGVEGVVYTDKQPEQSNA
ncbi:hypothetical protein CRUP_029677 [Coryphaenoides rupestris]|nr:hypothetical protein CRUP_029677 [Coryphaenoides rupestris]